jgi:urea transport system ATP-binding protein
MLDARGITLHYGGSQILYGIDLMAEPGQVTCIMGNNGVGKTSLLKVLSGSHPRSGGTLRLNGEELGRVNAQTMAARGIGYVPQGRMIFRLLPSGERKIPDAIFEHFPVLAEMSHRRGGDLSGGQQQQLSIARALITRPKVLLLDEPTEGIQPNIIQQIGRVIKGLRDRGDMAIVLVEQFFDFAYDLGDRFVMLERGREVLGGSRAEIPREQLKARLAGLGQAA